MKVTNNIEIGLKFLLEGEAIIFPTDTVYGIGVLPTKEAINKIYLLKERDKSKKIIALLSNVKYIEKIAKNIDYSLIDIFLPGPLSIIFETADKYKEILGETIGVRIPNNNIALDLIEKAGGIIMTSSANISGEDAVTDISKISKKLLNKVPCIIEADSKLSGIPSTIVLYKNNKYTLLREGEIKLEEFLKKGVNIETNKS